MKRSHSSMVVKIDKINDGNEKPSEFAKHHHFCEKTVRLDNKYKD